MNTGMVHYLSNCLPFNWGFFLEQLGIIVGQSQLIGFGSLFL